MEGIPLRNARLGDLPMLLLLWEQMRKENTALDARLAVHPRAKEHMAANLQRWIQDPDHLVIVAEEGKRLLVGFAAAGRLPGVDGGLAEGEISDCFVLGARRRRGIARRLVGRIEDQLEEKGVHSMRLQASAENAGSRAFWEAIGYTVDEVILERGVE